MVRFLVVFAIALGTILAAIPFSPAEAQWVFVARMALGRIYQMTEGRERRARATTSLRSSSMRRPTRCSRPRWKWRARTRRSAS